MQAEEIQRQRVLLMEGKLPKCPKELRNHPVLIMNESTNNFVIKRRAKVSNAQNNTIYLNTCLVFFCFSIFSRFC